MYVRVRPRTLEESTEELGVEYDKLEVSNSKVEIDSVINLTPMTHIFFFHARQINIVSILYFRVDLQYSKGKGASCFLELSSRNSICTQTLICCFDCKLHLIENKRAFYVCMQNEHCILLTRLTNKLQADYLNILTWISEI